MPTAKYAHLPAPVGGINSIGGAGDIPPTDALLMCNLVGSQYGIKVRPGYANSYYINGASVRSILPFYGSANDGSQDALFEAHSAKITGLVGSLATYTFGTQTGNAGYCTAVEFNTSADRYLVVCDEVNGLVVYAQSTNTWAAVTMGNGAGQISGVDPATFCHVTVFKNRLWFVQKNSTLAWYLGTNAVFGAATSFDFGPRMKAGGDLRGLFNWSYDGGNGIDTLLVGISGGGDIVIYQGTDPATAASFGLKGTWSVAGVPAGRRIATDYGGDLLVLSTAGVIPLSRLVVGGSDIDKSQYSTYKISNAFSAAMAAYSANMGWGVFLNPADSTLLINVPNGSSQIAFQFVMSLPTKAWSQYGDDGSTTCLGYPMLHAGTWRGSLYFGAGQNVHQVTSTTYEDIDNSGTHTIEWQLLTAFTDAGSPTQKQITQIRPRFLTKMQTTPNSYVGLFSAGARYNGDVSELPAISSTTVPTTGGALTAYQPIFGATGIGASVAVALRGKASDQTNLLGIDITYLEGGFQ